MKQRRALSNQQIMIVGAIVVIVLIGGIYYFTQIANPPSPPPENKPPIVVVSSTKTFAKLGEEVGFSAEGSKDTDGEIVKYSWNLGDKTTADGMIVTHSYKTAGNYIAIVTITDNTGNSTVSDSQPLFVKVEPTPFIPTVDSPPITVMAASKQIINVAESIKFDGASSYGWQKPRDTVLGDPTKIKSWNWDFGDGTSSVEKIVDKVYTSVGIYYATLTIEDQTGQKDIAATTIRVLPTGAVYTGVIKNPDTYVFANNNNVPIMVDPFFYGDQGRPFVLALTDRLTFTGNGDIEPKAEGSLSERWEVSPDGLHFTFYLRKGVKFWNGDELKAVDVEYSYERALALRAATQTWSLLYERLMGVRPGNTVPPEAIKNAIEVIDDYTVQFNFVQPYAAFLVDLAYPSQGIIQKKYAIEHGAWSWDDTRDWKALNGVDQPMWDGDALMATGPFKVKDKSVGGSITLERFDGYWQGPAKIKYFRSIYVLEWSTRKLMLEAGDVDGITIPSSVEFEQIVGLSGVTPFMYKYGGFVECIYFGVNFDPSLQPPENLVPSDFFDVHMRRAFAYAFPYEKYIQEVWIGYAEAAKGVLPPGWLGAYENYPYEYDLTKAAEELKLSHGGKYWDEGFQVVAGCQIWATATHGRAYQMLGEELAKIDPKFKVVVVSDKWSDMLARPLGMMVAVNGIDPSWYRNVYHSVYGFERSYLWKNERVDQLIEDSTKTPFIEERLPMIKEAMDIVADECPVILTVFPPHLVALRDYIHGYYFQVNCVNAQGNVYYISKG